MSGIPQHNFPLFDHVAHQLRDSGYEIISPSELDDPETRAKSLASLNGGPIEGHTWGDFLCRDVKLIADSVDGIIFLPNWEKSRGARLEAYVALLTGKTEFALYHDWGPLDHVPPAYIRSFLKENI
jgi:hypothetical protein